MITVKRIDGDEYRCICPLHDDDTESLSINIKKNAAICFADCFKGSAVDLVCKVEKLPKSVAWRKLVSGEVFDFDLGRKRTRKSDYSTVNYNGMTWVPGDYVDYLVKRKFDRSTIRYWNIEYCAEINHIRIPVIDKNGKTVSYSYRTLDDDVQPKYLHPGFPKKDGLLFGENMFEPHNDVVNLVEGALDCIWLWQNGYFNTLAFLGMPAEEQMLKIFDFGSKFRLCLDGDTAGRNMTDRLIEFITESEGEVWSILVPDGKDVQDLDTITLIQTMKGQ